MHIDYGLVEYLRRDAELIVESQAWVEERTSGEDESIEVRNGGYLLETGAGEGHSVELRLPELLDPSRDRCDVIAVEVDIESLSRAEGDYVLGLHSTDGQRRLEWRSDRTDPLVVTDGTTIVADAPGRHLRNFNRHVHRLEFDRRQQVLRHYVDGSRSAEIADESVLPDAATFGGVFTISSIEADPTETVVRRISHVAGQRRGPE